MSIQRAIIIFDKLLIAKDEDKTKERIEVKIEIEMKIETKTER